MGSWVDRLAQPSKLYSQTSLLTNPRSIPCSGRAGFESSATGLITQIKKSNVNRALNPELLKTLSPKPTPNKSCQNSRSETQTHEAANPSLSATRGTPSLDLNGRKRLLDDDGLFANLASSTYSSSFQSPVDSGSFSETGSCGGIGSFS